VGIIVKVFGIREDRFLIAFLGVFITVEALVVIKIPYILLYKASLLL